MNGLCDVQGCSEATCLGWRPLTESRGRQICEQHWHRHQDDNDSFDLYDEFGFRRPEGMRKPIGKKDIPHCSCGRELLPGRNFSICAAERERKRKKRAYHERKNPKPEPIVQENILLCRACGGTRKPGYTYCPKCSEKRDKQSNRER